MLAHPYSPELTGRNLKDIREGRGRSLGEMLLAAVTRPENPFTIYYWYKPNTEIMARKIIEKPYRFHQLVKTLQKVWRGRNGAGKKCPETGK